MLSIQSIQSEIIFTNTVANQIQELLFQWKGTNIFILVDKNTSQFCLPIIRSLADKYNCHTLVLEPGDQHKNLENLALIWRFLGKNKADRKSLLINLGGGVISDIGGFAASTFKRGIKFWNIPTSLLAMVDASVGGKTGINFNGLKNEIGTFSFPEYVIIDPVFLDTLDKRNWLSGFAEMIKHALISQEDEWLHAFINNYDEGQNSEMIEAIHRSVIIKNEIILEDPNETGIRKALNFGHTIGHAFESFFAGTENSLLHGEAIANGIICELYLSHKKLNYPESRLNQWVTFIRQLYPKANITNQDIDQLLYLMTFDKKNESGKVNFTLIEKPGKIKLDNYLYSNDITDALLFFIDLM